jgi:hypothetical protein
MQPDTKAAPRTRWEPPHIKVEWGSYFKPDPEEQAKIVRMCVEAMGANVVPLRSVIEKLAPIFGFDNIDAIVELIEEEQSARDERELEKTTSEAEALHKLAGGIDGGATGKPEAGSGARGRGNPAQGAGGGSRGAAAAPKKKPRPAP